MDKSTELLSNNPSLRKYKVLVRTSDGWLVKGCHDTYHMADKQKQSLIKQGYPKVSIQELL